MGINPEHMEICDGDQMPEGRLLNNVSSFALVALVKLHKTKK